MTEHTRFNGADGSAALGICESLLLALTDLKVITPRPTHGCCHVAR